MSGWFKLYRSLSDKAYYKKDSEMVHFWIHLLIKAAHSDREEMLGGKPIICKPGQFTTGRKQLSEQTGINESKIERMLTFFEKTEQQIEQQKSNKNRLITILNWDEYQVREHQTEQQPNNTSSENMFKSSNIGQQIEQQNSEITDSLTMNNDGSVLESEHQNEQQLNNNRTTTEHTIRSKELKNVFYIKGEQFFIEEKYIPIMEQMLSDQLWLEQAICMNLKLSPTEASDFIKQFFVLRTNEGNIAAPDLQECKQHFANWVRIQKHEQQKKKGGNNGSAARYAKHAANDKPAEKAPKDYSGSF